MEQFEEFKKKIMLRIDGEEKIPEEVMNLVMQMFEQVEEIYNQNGCNNSSISERIYLESRAMQRMLNERITEDIRNEQFQSAMVVMDGMQRYLEDMEQESSQMSEEDLQDIENRMEKETREGILEIGGDNEQIVSTIMMAMEDVLKDIRLSQNRILYNRGELSADRIYDIQQQVLDAIRQFQNRDQEIWRMLQQNDSRLREEILEQYEAYIQYRSQSQKEKSEADTFRDSLNAGISLDEQADLAKQFLREKEEANDSKLLVDELPELFL